VLIEWKSLVYPNFETAFPAGASDSVDPASPTTGYLYNRETYLMLKESGPEKQLPPCFTPVGVVDFLDLRQCLPPHGKERETRQVLGLLRKNMSFFFKE
jgi:hypothetical protein